MSLVAMPAHWSGRHDRLNFRGWTMRELIVAVVLSIIALTAVMLLPYPVDASPAKQAAAVTPDVPGNVQPGSAH